MSRFWTAGSMRRIRRCPAASWIWGVEPSGGSAGVTRLAPANNDLFGHGTAVASIIARIAPNARLYDVRVLGRSNTGAEEALIAGSSMRSAAAGGAEPEPRGPRQLARAALSTVRAGLLPRAARRRRPAQPADRRRRPARRNCRPASGSISASSTRRIHSGSAWDTRSN